MLNIARSKPCPSTQVYDQCPSAGSADCMDNSTMEAVGCEVTSVAGRVGSSYAARLSGPESVSGTVEHTGDGIFAAHYVGPVAGEYELEVRPGRAYRTYVFAYTVFIANVGRRSRTFLPRTDKLAGIERTEPICWIDFYTIVVVILNML